MGVSKLKQAISALPAQRGAADVAKLEESIGDRLNAKESAVLAELLEKEWKSFSKPGLDALEKLAGRVAPTAKAAKFEVQKPKTTGVDEISSVAFVDGALLAIDDKTAVVWKLNPGGKPIALREDDGVFDDLEGLCHDAKRSCLLVVTETERGLYEIPLSEGGDLKKPKKLGKLPGLAEDANSGCEGITLLTLPGQKNQVIGAVNEKDPLALSFLDRSSLEEKGRVLIPEPMGLLDVSDLCVDPKTGHLFLLSDESEVVVEAELRKAEKYLGPGPLSSEWSLVEVGRTVLPGLSGDTRLQPEGITIDEHGDLFVTSEGNQSVMRLKRVG
ncbi:MAG: SdiA-regulated domain-containing protein [Deltaproteobacteria bacterium]|nr:SdiA-regulated domain-containing protein [Deltaproteobacteria bacterium]